MFILSPPLTVDAAIAKIDTETLLRGLVELDVNHSKLSNPAEICSDEQAWANGFLYEHTMDSGDKVVLPRPPVRFDSMPDTPGQRAPYLGEHSAEIMQQLGYSPKEVQQALENGGVVQHSKKNS